MGLVNSQPLFINVLNNMACSSLLGLPRPCGDGNVAGLEKLYAIAFSDLAAVSGSTEVYSVSEGGLIDEIGVDAGKAFVEIGLLKSTSGLQEALTKDNATASAFFTQTFTLVLGGQTQAVRDWVKSVMMQPVALIYKSRMGNFYAIGLNGQFELSATEGGSGVAETDLAGYTLTFTGISLELVKQIDATIIADLITV